MSLDISISWYSCFQISVFWHLCFLIPVFPGNYFPRSYCMFPVSHVSCFPCFLMPMFAGTYFYLYLCPPGANNENHEICLAPLSNVFQNKNKKYIKLQCSHCTREQTVGMLPWHWWNQFKEHNSTKNLAVNTIKSCQLLYCLEIFLYFCSLWKYST